jgi:hypothetical protein
MATNRKPLIIRNQVILGIYQLIGGLWGLGLIAYSLFNSFELTSITLIVLIVGIVLFGFSAYCGIICIKKENNALYLSRINQYLQLITISGTYFGFLFVAGVGIFFGLDLVGGLLFRMNFELSTLTVYYSEQTFDKQVAINLVSLFLLFNFNTLLKERKLASKPTIE